MQGLKNCSLKQKQLSDHSHWMSLMDKANSVNQSKNIF